METIKDSNGKLLFEGTEELVFTILDRFIETQFILRQEGNGGKYDRDTLLRDCIIEQIKFEEKSAGFETASEVKDFRKSFKIHFK